MRAEVERGGVGGVGRREGGGCGREVDEIEAGRGMKRGGGGGVGGGGGGGRGMGGRRE